MPARMFSAANGVWSLKVWVASVGPGSGILVSTPTAWQIELATAPTVWPLKACATTAAGRCSRSKTKSTPFSVATYHWSPASIAFSVRRPVITSTEAPSS